MPSSKPHHFSDEVTIVLGGSAGQGLQTIEKVITMLLMSSGYFVFSTSEYMSRVRGGSNSTEIRITSERRRAFVRGIDIAFALDADSLVRLSDRFGENTLVIADESLREQVSGTLGLFVPIPLVQSAEEVGGKIYMNTIVAGSILAMLGVKDEGFQEYLKKVFQKKGEKVVENNIQGAIRGRGLGEKIANDHNVRLHIPTRDMSQYLFLDGTHAVALGAVSAGCNFVSSYPMSPSTGVFTALAQFSEHLDIAVEQVEDEITASNMAVGAWFAGARALVTTSGGGFALMAETMSLAGMTENPLVIHLAQRPGPATGLPTRTEQGDLQFSLHIGHGDFPRVILAPGTTEECFECAKKAFDMADKYQVPVILMTDQYILDSYAQTEQDIFIQDSHVQKYFVETSDGYKRYAYTDDGLSPRGIPGFGNGFVHADSDEHNEDGRIIEDAETRVKMMDKRMYRLELIREDALESVYRGSDHPTFLIIGWGSTYGVLSEVLDRMKNKHLGYLHVRQVFPLAQDVVDRVKNAERIIVVENNRSGQFADILHLACNRKPDHIVGQYDGWPFSVESLEQNLRDLTM